MHEPTDDAESTRMVTRLPPTTPAVARAMRRVPRRRFVPAEYQASAYDDTPIPLPFGEATVSAPHMVAVQLEFAELRAGLRVLEVGVGFGYLAALIAEMVGPEGAVFAVDVEPGLAREATRRLAESEIGRSVHVRQGDGRLGWPDAGPFDRLIASCAVAEVPWAWFHALTPHGLLVAPVGDSLGQRLARWRNDGGAGTWEYGVSCRFVPLRTVLPSDI